MGTILSKSLKTFTNNSIDLVSAEIHQSTIVKSKHYNTYLKYKYYR